MKNYFILIVALTVQNFVIGQTPLFESVLTEKSNIYFNNKIDETNKDNIFIYDNFYAGAGVGLGDINNDGLVDIYFCGNQVKDKLYINKGDFVFQDITQSSGIEEVDSGWSSSVTMADINNDGFLDIYVTKELHDHNPNWRKDRLYLNNGNNTFTEVAEKIGLGNTTRSRGAAFFDFDKDEDLDLFVLHQPPNPGIYSEYLELSKSGALLEEKYAPRLYENKEGQFIDISKKANVLTPGFSNAVSIADINNDGYPDIIVANDFEAPDLLYLNNGDKTFRNIANSAFRHTSFYSMGIDVSDINNDGFLDVYVVDMVAEDNFRLKSNMSGMDPKKFQRIVDKGWNRQYMFNTLQLNNGNNTFSDVAQFANIAATDWSWTPLIADFDNDGKKDVFVTNGLLRDIRNTDADVRIKQYVHKKIQEYLAKNGNLDNVEIWDLVSHNELSEIYPSSKLQNKFFKNDGDFKFQDVSETWVEKKASFSNGASYGDLDNDGDLDIVVNNINDDAFILENKSDNNANSNFLRIELLDENNRPVFGTKVKLYVDQDVQVQETTNVRGIYSTSESLVHFGLGNIAEVDSIIVTWPNQTKLVKRKIRSNQKLDVFMNDRVEALDKLTREPSTSLLTNDTEFFDIKFKHEENDFDDYKYQVLLPHKLSQFGPAAAKGDVNNDGLEDLFLGGATGTSPVLYIQNSHGNFVKEDLKFWSKEKAYEDVDAVFCDINGDGYQDLYVVSGGNEFPVNDQHYIDRIYLNDGYGKFSKGAILNVIPSSGSKVKASDFDGDGDIDLFVGGRHLPHNYPLPATSMLLVNENGQLVNKTNKLAKEFENLGLVTDAVWSDYDSDGDKDLVVVGEWMPITIFQNDAGYLKKVTKNNGLEDSSGWWFSVEKGDFDNDGDLDFISGNLGLNYKYKTSKENPFDIYYNDFDGNGNYDIVLGYYNKGKHFPLRGFSCSSQQIPNIKTKFKEYNLFASLEIEDVYGAKNLDNSIHYTADTFASSYIENLGNGNFKMSLLPQMAQISNINDILVEDINNDGFQDLITVGNLFVSEIETTRNDAGYGLVMLGNGNGSFTPLANGESGFFAREDAKKILLLSNSSSKRILVVNNNNYLQSFLINQKKE